MRDFKDTKAFTYLTSALLITVGIILVLWSRSLTGDLGNIFEFSGVTLIGVFGVSLIYEVLVAQRHFRDFKVILSRELRDMDSVQSQCMKMGIKAVFDTRNTYQAAHPLAAVINEAPPGSSIVCVARSMFHLLNQTDELKRGLQKGIQFSFACVDPNKITPSLRDTALLYRTDIDSALTALQTLLAWAEQEKPAGSIELRYHDVDFPDSAFQFTSQKVELLAWDLSFGRDLSQKRVLLLDCGCPLGADLKARYLAIYRRAEVQASFTRGQYVVNRLWANEPTK